MIGGFLHRHPVAGLGEQAHGQRNPLARALAEHDVLRPGFEAVGGKSTGNGLPQGEIALVLAVHQQLAAVLLHHPVEGLSKGGDGIKRRIRRQRVQRNRAVHRGVAGPAALQLQQPLHQRREGRGVGAVSPGAASGADKSAAPHGGFQNPVPDQ